MKVCILAAGLGSRLGAVSEFLHKALLPLGNRAVLSRIIDYFPPDSEFVIAVGNRAEQVRAFVGLAHPGLKVEFVDVDPFTGPGAGPGFSLYSCRAQLQQPFVFTACDTLNLKPLPAAKDGNWLGVAEVSDPQNWCAVSLDAAGNVVDLDYKRPGSTATHAFTGLAHVHDFAAFWRGLETGVSAGSGEIQVNDGLSALVPKGLRTAELDWRDTGDWASYQALQLEFDKNVSFTGKTTEVTYLYGDRVLKIYPSAEKAQRCARRAEAFAGSVPQVLGCSGPVLAYRYAPGTLLSAGLNARECRRFLDWLQRDFWVDLAVDADAFRAALGAFYIDKTLDRLERLDRKSPDRKPEFDGPLVINGVSCAPAPALVRRASARMLSGAIASTMHGDLHADNVIQAGAGYVLIDWRDSFADLDVGDRYYDLAKFLHTLDLSVKTMEAGDFQVVRRASGVEISHRCEFREVEARDAFWAFVAESGYDRGRIELVNALIFLNMAPLYEAALGLYLYYLGRYLLQKCLQED